MDFLTRFDGTGREPRQIQHVALDWLAQHWDEVNVFVMSLPTGAGKSAIARAIQLATKADVVPPSNQLMDQYSDTYPTVNTLKGKAKYTCHNLKLSCSDASLLSKPETDNMPGHCPDCPYRASRRRAASEPTFFNPHSLFYYHLTADKAPNREVLVIDEAHGLYDTIMDMAGASFNSNRYTLPTSLADVEVEKWLIKQSKLLQDLAAGHSKAGDKKKAAAAAQDAQRVGMLIIGYKDNPENYAVYFQQNVGSYSLVMKPVTPPRAIVRKMLVGKKIVLMSATIMPPDIEELLGHKNFLYLDLPSPIPVTSRPVIYSPAKFPMNWKADPADVVRAIMDVIEHYPNRNTIIHVSYGWSERLAPYFKVPIIRNTKENKDEKIAEFKTKGGIFLAAGCSEGLDLPGDQCRLNIIPILHRLNPSDPLVKKRLGLPNGETWYAYQTLRTVIQQAGRSTRGLDDWSTTVVLDSSFPRLMTRKDIQAPVSFRDAIQWRHQ